MVFASTVGEHTERLSSAVSSEIESKNASLPAGHIPLGSQITVRNLSGQIVFDLEVGTDPMLPAEFLSAHVYLVRIHLFIAEKMLAGTMRKDNLVL